MSRGYRAALALAGLLALAPGRAAGEAGRLSVERRPSEGEAVSGGATLGPCAPLFASIGITPAGLVAWGPSIPIESRPRRGFGTSAASPTGFEMLAAATAVPVHRSTGASFGATDTVALAADAPPPTLWRSGLLRPDRLHHASFALSSGLAVGLLTQEPVAGLGGALVLGLVKEIWDGAGGGRFDLVDLAADAIGAGAAAVLTSGLLR